VKGKNGDKVNLNLRARNVTFSLSSENLISSLRSYSKVKHLDVSDEEEVAIINPSALPNEVLQLTGLMPINEVIKAANDIAKAYEDLASNMLLVRRTQVSSPELHWLAFYSQNKVLGTTSALLNLHIKDQEFVKPLMLYLNSIVTLIQLIGFVAETRGAWVTFHGKQVWSHIHIPKLENLQEANSKAQEIFQEIRKLDVKPLFKRLKEHDPIQRTVDSLALEMLGLNDWKSRLDEIYDAVTLELEAMHKILETSKTPRKSKIKLEHEEKRETDLSKWFG
jgi:hypothetical protein